MFLEGQNEDEGETVLSETEEEILDDEDEEEEEEEVEREKVKYGKRAVNQKGKKAECQKGKRAVNQKEKNAECQKGKRAVNQKGKKAVNIYCRWRKKHPLKQNIQFIGTGFEDPPDAVMTPYQYFTKFFD